MTRPERHSDREDRRTAYRRRLSERGDQLLLLALPVHVVRKLDDIKKAERLASRSQALLRLIDHSKEVAMKT